MKRVLSEIQSGQFAKDMDGGEQERPQGVPLACGEAGATHQLEKVGEKLRSMMPWIAKNRLVDKSKN